MVGSVEGAPTVQPTHQEPSYEKADGETDEGCDQSMFSSIQRNTDLGDQPSCVRAA